MKFLTYDEDIENGDPSALSEREIENLIKFIRPTSKDIFYDLGSGYGEIIRQFIKKTKIKLVHGIEDDIKRFLLSIEYIRDELTEKQLRRLEIWRSNFNNYDFSKATIIYNGIDIVGNDKRNDFEEIKLYNKLFPKREVKIIKRDFPLIGYKPVKAFRSKKDSWFFMMKTPLEEHRLQNYDDWLFYVFRKKDKTINDIVNHYKISYKNREIDLTQKDLTEFKRNFKRVVKKQFKI